MQDAVDMPAEEFDVVVVGAGAAGMMAAWRAAEAGAKVALLEKNRKPGAKILISGGTRCNLTHDTDVAGILTAFGEQGRFLRTAVHHFTPQDVVGFFRRSGVMTKIETETGKVFPASDRAWDVQQALIRRVQGAGALLLTETSVSGLLRDGQLWSLGTSRGSFRAKRIIITTGGCSYAGCGTTGDAWNWLSPLGHTIVTPRPALVPLTSNQAWVVGLSGTTMTNVHLAVIERTAINAADSMNDLTQRLAWLRKHQRCERRGALLFTHFGLSGPVVLDVSRRVTDCANSSQVCLVADWLPQHSIEQLQGSLNAAASRDGGRSIGRWLSSLLTQRLADALLQQADLDGQRKLAELSRAQRIAVLGQLKSCAIDVSGSRGFSKAEVTAGGVALTDVDAKSMASRRAEGLYLAGEVLDVDGPIGGYNFQAAFSTGILAGEFAARQNGV